MLTEGASFAAYEVQRRIAVGGMGEVYLCRHRMLDRLDAVKVLRPHLATDENFRRRFLREAHSAARLRHRNVVAIYTADEAAGLLYLAMEYVPGEDLAALLERSGPLDPHRTVRLLALVADALDTAHRAQLVHRDIKPSNLLVTGPGTPDESVTLVDFGISRPMDGDSEITRTGEIVGTLAYCAPEQLSRVRVDGACDQYALACVAYECLTGSVPYPRDGQLAIMAAHLTAPPPRASARRPELPAAVDAVLARAMAKEPGQRYPTCARFVAELADALVVAGDHPDFPAPAALLAHVRQGQDLVRPAGHPDALTVRLGWGERGPVVAPLAAEALAIRGEPGPVAATLRWLLTQVAVRHPARDVCVVAAVVPQPDDGWLWAHWLPHARPSTAPVAGPHVATTADAAEDLLVRVRQVVQARAEGAAAQPRLLAVVDARYGRPVDGWLTHARRLGVHLLHLLPPGAPTQLSTLDIQAESCRYHRAGSPPVHLGPDAVSAAYARELVDLLAEE